MEKSQDHHGPPKTSTVQKTEWLLLIGGVRWVGEAEIVHGQDKAESSAARKLCKHNFGKLYENSKKLDQFGWLILFSKMKPRTLYVSWWVLSTCWFLFDNTAFSLKNA